MRQGENTIIVDTISAIVIHFSNLENTQTCLRSLFASTGAFRTTVVVVDMSKKPSEADSLRQEFDTDQLHIVSTTTNLGFAEGNNVGIEEAIQIFQPKTIVLLNDDATVSPTTLATLHQSLHAKPKRGMVVPKIYFTAGREFHPGYKKSELGNVFWYAGGVIDWREVVGFHRGVDEVDRGQYDTPQSTPFATGCCVAINPKMIDEIGAFTASYFLYLEDLELSLRAEQNGWQVWYEPSAHAWHQNAGSSSSGSALHVYYQTRNRFRLGFAWAPLRTKLFLLKYGLFLLRTGTDPERRAILDVVQHRYGYQPLVHTPHH